MARGASLSWSAPSGDGGATIIGYVLTYGAASLNLSNTLAATVSLAPGAEYAFTLRAQNSVGLGAAATAAVAISAVAPSAPLSLTAAALEGGASLSWLAPASDGGATVTGYVLSYGSETVTLGNTLAATLGGLTAGEEYAFTLQAGNAVGLGAAATAGVSLLATTPSAPVGFTASAVVGGATLSWSAPENNGSSSVTGYVLTYGAETVTLGNTLAATVGGLTAGEEYAFTLRAGNAVGLGAAATAAATISAVAPSAPQSLTATAVEGGASLSWLAPAFDGGASVTGYVLTYGSETINLGATLAATVGGLRAGEEYAFTLRAGNAVGLGAAATAAVAISAVAPSAPQSLTATAVEGGASLSWLAPAFDGGASVTGYVLTYGSETINLGATLAATVGGLTPGAAYAFTLRAGNAVGLGASATAAASLANVPDAPVDFTASAFVNGAGASLSWSAPTVNGGSAITGYVLSYGDVSQSFAATVTAATVGGLLAGEEYAFTLRAGNAVGLGASATAAASLASAPSAPVSLTAVALVGGASLQWSAPASDGGASVTGYILTYGTVSQNIAATVTAATVGGLLAGEEYAFTLQAGNAVGLGAVATAAASLLQTAPDAPVSLQANAISLAARLVWQTPAHDGGASITNYVVSYGTLTTNLGVALTATITGLTAGEEYAFTLRAQNSVGLGAAATAAASLAPAGAPGPPQSLTASAIAGGASLTWSAPASDGGASVTGYVLSYGTVSQALPATARATVVVGLTPGAAYTFTLRAANSVGAGDATLAEVVVPAVTPSAPQSLTAVAVAGEASLSWSAPASDGGASITNYVVSYGTVTTNLGDVLTATITGLAAGAEYDFTLRAANSVGLGAGASAAVSLPNVPSAPLSLMATVVAAVGGSYVNWSINWLAPASDGGSRITGYVLTYSESAASQVTTRIAALPGGSGFFGGGITPGSTYTMTLRAANAVGLGAAALAIISASLAVPAAPFDFVASAFYNGEGASLSWTAPQESEATITNYVLRYGSQTLNLSNVLSATVGGLTVGAEYSFTLRAQNSIGEGVAVIAAAIMPTLPGAPVDFSAAVLAGGGASLSWSPPASNGGAPLTAYVLTYGDVTQNIAAATTAATIGGLTLGGEYAFTLQAGNGVGLGAGASAAVSLPNIPSAPISLLATALAGGASLSWSAPASDGGATITGYVLSYGDASQNIAATATAATVGGLTPGAEYAFTLRAGNISGLGASATAAAVTVPAVAPSAPVGFTASAVAGGASLSWSAPASDGGASVTGYVLSYGGLSESLPATARATVINGLTPGAAYTFTLRAANSAGAGAATIAAATIPAVVPDAPLSLTAVAVEGGASLSWLAPASDGGASVTGYVLSYGTETINLDATTAATVGGLLAGEEYAFTLQAANSVGAGAAATAAATIPAVLPGAPQSLTAVAVAGGASLSWSAPASDGGASVTGYVLSYGSETVTLGATLAATVGGLAAGEEYMFTLQAANSVGLGATATAAVAIPAVTPSAPQDLTAVAFVDGRGASLSWSAPASDGGAAVTGYVLTYGDVSQNLAASVTAATVGGLTPGAEYAFTLRAGNAVGLGVAATAGVSLPVTAPSAPVSLQANAISLEARLVWQEPAHNGGASITNYVVSYGTITTNLGVALSATIGSLAAGEEYVFTLRAQNSVGLGLAAVADVSLAPAGAPSAPVGFTASAVAGGASLSWSAPANDGGASVTGYVLSYGAVSQALPATARSTVISGLTPGACLCLYLCGRQTAPARARLQLPRLQFPPLCRARR